MHTPHNLGISHYHRAYIKMSAVEKDRTSGEVERPEQAAPMLPVVNPAVEKPAPAKTGGLHPAVYIA